MSLRVLLIIALIFGLYGLNLFAEVDSSFLVKTYSSSCTNPQSEMRGSGSLFIYKDQVYVLTSEHVLYHSKDSSFCHFVENKDIGKVEAELLWADWGLGIALLSVPLSANDGYLKFPEDFISPPKRTQILTAGYPHSGDQPLLVSQGSIANKSSQRHLFSLLDKTYELIGAHGEFGMSGGAVVSRVKKEVKFLGLLSHQLLVLRSGESTGVHEWDRPHKQENHLIAIRAQDIVQVLDRYFKSPDEFRVSFYRYTPSQIKKVTSIISSGFIFHPRLHKPKKNDSDDDHSTDNPGEIGGVDPVGIGGGVINADGPTVEMKIESYPLEEFKTYWSFTHLNEWIEQVRAFIFNREEVQLSVLVFQKNSNASLQLAWARSPQEYFSLLRSKNIRPIAIRPLSKLNDKSIKNAQSVYDLLLNYNENELKLHVQSQFQSLKNYAFLIAQGYFYLVPCEDFEKLLDKEKSHDLWNELLIKDFNYTVEILRVLKLLSFECRH